jgi:putative sigma-54 modulation protein
MTISIQYVKMPQSDTMNEFTTARLEKLAKKYDWLINATVHFKTAQDNNGRNKVCEIELSAPGPRIFASSIELHFESAVKETIRDLERQLKKRKATRSN